MAIPVENWEGESTWEQNSEVIDITEKKLALPAIHGYIESAFPDTSDQALNLLMVAGWVASAREDLLRTCEDRFTILGEPAQKTSLEILNSIHHSGQLRLSGRVATNGAYDQIFDLLLSKGSETEESLTTRLGATIGIKSAFLDGTYPSYTNHVIWSSTEALIKTTSIKVFKSCARDEYNSSLSNPQYELDSSKFDLEIFKKFARMPHWDNLLSDTLPIAREEIEAEKRFISWITTQGKLLSMQQSLGRSALD